ncbi:MAG: hypothetical protein LLG93_10175 [Deltaproteobacteria bacterium]|nr:hypothetical protein [Deltaproteobacteria bacterium]
MRTRVETITILDGEDGASGGHYTFDNESCLGILNWVGLGVTYFKSNTFSGFSWGLDVSFAL